jgi:Ca2+/Na+ antiporter
MVSVTDFNEIGEIMKGVAEFIAWISAALFFLYKVSSGYLISGLSMKVECRRTTIKGESFVAVTVITKKGNMGTTQLHDAMIVIRDVSTGAMVGEPTRFKTIRRLACDINKSPLEIVPDKISRDAPLLNFAPGDEMQFAGVAKLPDDDLYLVEAIILGKWVVAWTNFIPDFLDAFKKRIQKSQNFAVGQWRGSCVLTENKKPAVK